MRIIAIIKYAAQAIHAISVGLAAAADHWPNHSPFDKEETPDTNGKKGNSI